MLFSRSSSTQWLDGYDFLSIFMLLSTKPQSPTSQLNLSVCPVQVMENAVPNLRKVAGQQVFRAKFSAISAPELKAAMVRRGKAGTGLGL